MKKVIILLITLSATLFQLPTMGESTRNISSFSADGLPEIAPREKKLIGTCKGRVQERIAPFIVDHACRRKILDENYDKVVLGTFVTEYNGTTNMFEYYELTNVSNLPPDLAGVASEKYCPIGDKECEQSKGQQMEYDSIYNSVVATAYALGNGISKSCKPVAGGMPGSVQGFIDASDTFAKEETEQSKAYRAYMAEKGELLKADISEFSAQPDAIEYHKDTLENALNYLVGIDFSDKGDVMVEERKVEEANNNSSRVQRRLALWEKLVEAKQRAQAEHMKFIAAFEQCSPLLAQATTIADEGCKRTKTVQDCDGDGNCTSRQEPDPVPGSCEALGEIPSFNSVLASYKATYDRVMPSKLHNLALERIEIKYERMANNYLSPGAWRGPVSQCIQLTKKERQANGVLCDNFREDHVNADQWNVPSEGNFISDLYETVLGRKADSYGFEHWKKYYDERKEQSATHDEIITELKNHFINSHENQGRNIPEELVEEHIERHKGNVLCTERDEKCAFSKDEFKVTFEDDLSAKKKQFQEEGREFLAAVVEGQVNLDALTDTYVANWNIIDLYLGQSAKRFMPVEALEEQINRLNALDIDKAKKLLEQRNEMLELLQNLNELAINADGSGETVTTTSTFTPNGTTTNVTTNNDGQQALVAALDAADNATNSVAATTPGTIPDVSSALNGLDQVDDLFSSTANGNSAAATLKSLGDSIDQKNSAFAKTQDRIIKREEKLEKKFNRSPLQSIAKNKDNDKVETPNLVGNFARSGQWNERLANTGSALRMAALNPSQRNNGAARNRTTLGSSDGSIYESSGSSYPSSSSSYGSSKSSRRYGSRRPASRSSYGKGQSSSRDRRALSESVDYLKKNPNYKYRSAKDEDQQNPSIFTIITNRYQKTYDRVQIDEI